MTEDVIRRVNELGSGEPELLTWTNRRGETIGNGPLWDTTVASTNDASMTSEVTGATKDDDDDVVVAEEDRGTIPTTDVDVVDNIAGVDMRTDTQDTYEVWNEEVPEYDVGDVDQINNDVEVAAKLASGGVTTTRWDQPLKVIPAVTEASKVSPTGTGQVTRERKPPNLFIPSWTGKKYGYAMAQIEHMNGTVEESISFMQRELSKAGEHHRPEVIGMIMVQLSMKAAEKEFGVERTKKACRLEVEQIHMRNIFVPKHWDDLTLKQRGRILEAFIFVKQKKSGADKARLVIDGSQQQDHITNKRQALQLHLLSLLS